MLVSLMVPVTCWVCALVAIPHSPRPGNEVEELVYARLLGRHQRLVLLALIVTALAFLATVLMLPARLTIPEAGVIPPAEPICNGPAEFGYGLCN